MVEAISYKDPDGYVLLSGEKVLRFISHRYAPSYDHLMQSGLYDLLVKDGLLIPHEEATHPATGDKNIYKILEPEKIDLITFPYEWSFRQWKLTLLACLKINKIALDHGMILKDATPFNFTFHKGRVVLFDTSSFELYNEGEPWRAYKQFCEELLGPLALMKYRHPIWSSLFSAAIRGYDLPFISRQLPLSSRFNITCLLHIHLHSRYKNKDSGDSPVPSGRTGLNRQKLYLLWQMIERGVAGWKLPYREKGFWSDYYQDHIESKLYVSDKKDRLEQWLRRLHPHRVIDLGANTGSFSFLAAASAMEVVAIEADPFCVDKLYMELESAEIKNVIAVVADLTNPPGGLGLNNEERAALLERVHGDTVLGLALIHHLCMTYNVPLDLVAKLFSRLTTKYAIVEFIPKSDSKVKAMLKNRKDIFDAYSEIDFRETFSRYFDLEEDYDCQDSERKLFLWRKK